MAVQTLSARSAQSTPKQSYWSKYSVGILFVLPALLLYLIFVVYPFLHTFYISLTSWNGFSAEMTFVGLDNYIKLFQDPLFWNALGHNIIWIVVGSIGAIGLGLFLAVLMSSQPVGFLVFRTIYFMPQVLGPAIVGVIWLLIMAPRRGFFYQVGEALGLEWLQRSLLANSGTALYGVLLASIWASIGYFFVIFLAGLQNVDRDLLDAAKVDGANSWQQFRHVTVPQLSHVLTMVIAIGMINSLKVFDIVWAMTQGGPGNASEVLGTFAYQEAFNHSRHGYGTAIIMVTSALAMVMSIIFIRLRERREV